MFLFLICFWLLLMSSRLNHTSFADLILQLKKYDQPRKSHRTVSVNLVGNKVPLYGAGSSLAASQTGSYIAIPFTLDLEIHSRGDVVGKLVRVRHKKQISCLLVLDSTRTKPIKFKKDDCRYS
ncbi:hypothetical protein HS088_TW12G00350 [Tripterygium wilfordii]|uniref:Late embryogenesis abundant protein LEA-2 subgroup domain-containing protein n=1 Tax=Tripterygium wilfordii TaxID=458696 RepID=A0A7J7CYL1_TRIWF|nr:hypothetical protein HS088_TW12G00350 [Tripterygium wilfordii]